MLSLYLLGHREVRGVARVPTYTTPSPSPHTHNISSANLQSKAQGSMAFSGPCELETCKDRQGRSLEIEKLWVKFAFLIISPTLLKFLLFRNLLEFLSLPPPPSHP